MKPGRPAIYVRISDDREGESKGVNRQLEDCRGLVKAKGWPAAAEYNDNDTSAWKRGVVRKEFRRLLADIETGHVDAVVVYDSDRFYRQPRELEEFFDICQEAGLSQFAQVTGDVDIGSSDGELVLRIKGAVAAKESADKSRRIKRKALELARDGKVSGGGSRAFGFEDDRRTIRPSEAKIIVELKDRALAGESLRSMCFDLNEREIKTTTGGTWVPQVLGRMLKSARISGRREHRGEIVATAEWPPIISASDSDRLRAVLSDPSRRKNHRVRRYLLAGMLLCEHCKQPMISRPRDDGVRRYVCAKRPGYESCGKISILSEPLEELITEMVLLRVEGPALSRALSTKDGDSSDVYQGTIDEANRQLEELARVYADQRISLSEWMAARAPIEERLEQAKSSLARTNGTSTVVEFIGHGTRLRERWDALALSRKRAILSTLLEHITIRPAVRGRNRFDPDRVSPTWRV